MPSLITAFKILPWLYWARIEALWNYLKAHVFFSLSAASIGFLAISIWKTDVEPRIVLNVFLVFEAARQRADIAGLFFVSLIQMLLVLMFAGAIVAHMRNSLTQSPIMKLIVHRVRLGNELALIVMLDGLLVATLVIDVIFAPVLWFHFLEFISTAEFLSLVFVHLLTLWSLVLLSGVWISLGVRISRLSRRKLIMFSTSCAYYASIMGALSLLVIEIGKLFDLAGGELTTYEMNPILLYLGKTLVFLLAPSHLGYVIVVSILVLIPATWFVSNYFSRSMRDSGWS